MPKPGIKIIEEVEGEGAELSLDDTVRIQYDISLSKGDTVARDSVQVLSLRSREVIAGLRNGLDGMKVGGTRRFKASPHLCYGDHSVPGVPNNAMLIFNIKRLEIVRFCN